MTAKPKEPEILNPHYKCATPELVARALLRHDHKADDEKAKDKPSNIIDQPDIQSSI